MEITDKNFEQEIIQSKIPALVDFWASWCPPCKMMEPVIDTLEKEFRGRVKIAKLNVDKSSATSNRYNIHGVPTFILFNGGKEIERHVSAKSEEELRKIANKLLEK